MHAKKKISCRQYNHPSPTYESLTSQRYNSHAFSLMFLFSYLFPSPLSTFLLFTMKLLICFTKEQQKNKPRIFSFSHYHICTISLNISVPVLCFPSVMDEVDFLQQISTTPSFVIQILYTGILLQISLSSICIISILSNR